MPLRSGTSRRTISANIRREAVVRPVKQAVAIALSKARETAPKHRIARAEGRGWKVVFWSTNVSGSPWYEVAWRKRGVSRAHRHFETANLARAREAFARFVREAGK